MYTKKIFYAAIVILLLWGCQKIIHGYISDRIFYQVNPFSVQQGITTVSASLVTDGSTEPLHVKVLALKDSAGNDVQELFATPGKISSFTGTITSADSTIDLFNAKIKDSMVAPFNIAEIGGRLQFTAATQYVLPGTYNLDLQVSNVRGQKILKNACEIHIDSVATHYNITYTSCRINDTSGKTELIRYDNNPAILTADIFYAPASDNKPGIVIKFEDKNGIPFNPLKGEVADWSDAPAASTSFPALHMWDPYYPTQETDTSLFQELPAVNFTFPYFDLSPTYTAAGGARIDNKISNTSTGNIIHTALQFYLYTTGKYYVTVHLNDVVHK